MYETEEVRRALLEEYLWSWARAAERQCDRALHGEGECPRDRLFDAILAIQAIRNAQRAAETLHKASGGHWYPQETLDNFVDEHSDVKDLRDILEHFDAYIVGKGKLQAPKGDPFRIRFDRQSGRLSVILTETEVFEVDLKALRNGVAEMVIDLVVSIDALEDEPHLFRKSQRHRSGAN